MLSIIIIKTLCALPIYKFICRESTITATFPRSSGSIDSGSNGPFSSNQDGEITFNSAKSRAAYNNADNSRMPNVVNALVRTYWPMLVLGAGMKLIHDIFQFVQPQLLILMIGFIEDPSIELWKGVLFASLMFITASLQSIALSVYFHRVYVVGMRMRTALISAVYR